MTKTATGKKKCFIYLLFDENDFFHIRYVGLTHYPVVRFRQHRDYYKYSKTKRAKWIKEVVDSGSSIVVSLEKCCSSLEEAKLWEKYYIDKYKKEGHDLVNSTLGGTGTIGFKHSKESREKMSRALLGTSRHTTPHTLESRRKISIAQIGRKASEETKKRMSESHLGRKKTAKARENMKKAWVLRKQKYGNSIFNPKQ